jgi:hypothetical protein
MSTSPKERGQLFDGKDVKYEMFSKMEREFENLSHTDAQVGKFKGGQ